MSRSPASPQRTDAEAGGVVALLRAAKSLNRIKTANKDEKHGVEIVKEARLFRRVKRSKRMLGDKAYDSAELREEIDERGSKPIIPNSSASTSISTGCVAALRVPLIG